MDPPSQSATWIDPSKSQHGLLRPRHLLLASDVISAFLAVLFAYLVARWRNTSFDQTGVTLLMAGLIVLFTLALLLRAGQYSSARRMAPLSDMGGFARDIVIASGITTLINYVTKGFFTGLTTPSRVSVGVALLTFAALAVIARVGLWAYQRRQYSQGREAHRILVAGDGPAADDFLDFVRRRPWLGIIIAGRLTHGERPTRSEDHKPPNEVSGVFAAAPETDVEQLPTFPVTDSLSGLEHLDRALRSSQADEVVIALDPQDQAHLRSFATLLSLAHVPFKVVPSLFEESYRAAEILGFAELPVIDVNVDALDRFSRTIKRSLDVLVSVTVLFVLLPLWLTIAVAIVVESGRPVFYSQERVGKNGRRFVLHKFRTMIKDADKKLHELGQLNEMDPSGGRMFKMRDDPRITRVGLLLRRLSLDEFPQFFNVLKGDMSVVGPRPPLPQEVENYEREHLYRLKALPGITGLWQVSGRNELSFEDMVRLDRYYLDHWSLGLDLSIMLRTIHTVLTRKGAY